MVVDIPNHSFSFSLSPFFLSLFSLFSLFSRVQLSGRADPAVLATERDKKLGITSARAGDLKGPAAFDSEHDENLGLTRTKREKIQNHKLSEICNC